MSGLKSNQIEGEEVSIRSESVQQSLSLEEKMCTLLMIWRSDQRAFVFIKQTIQLNMVLTYASSLRHLQAIRSPLCGRIVGVQGRCFRQYVGALPIMNQAVQPSRH